MTFTELGTLLFVDDEPAMCAANAQTLELAGLSVRTFGNAQAALAEIGPDFNGVVLSDLRMPSIDGLQFLHRVRAIDETIPFILMSGHADIATAVAALREGAHDFLEKPFAADHLVSTVRRALERRALEIDNRQLRSQLAAADNPSPLLGETPVMIRLRQTIERIASTDVDVLLEGETGTGKELIALLLHRGSRRSGAPFVVFNCGAVSHESAARELMGGADPRQREPGRIEAAHRGTLLIDEIERLDLETQSRLLRVIEDRTVHPLDGGPPRPVSVRFIAASRRELQAAAQDGTFREDLFYAINVVRLRVPPLRERRADIPLLFAHFLDEAAGKLQRSMPRLSQSQRRYLSEHDWPGNVRELRSYAFQAALGFEDVAAAPIDVEEPSLPERVERFEESVIRSVLEQTQGSASRAIERLGIPRKTFYDKLSRHRIDIRQYRR